ncbi:MULTISPECIES: hypothetical protein [unclassified Frankia]|uniref:hypothetical protein n=1 Tax=unclassified Frankia TaxID=2632575 RepID=UPI001EE48543|nr:MULTISPECIES: hypothetical protein [unclassified Frankia]
MLPVLTVHCCWNTGELYVAPAVAPDGRAPPRCRYAQPVLQLRLYFVCTVPGDPLDPMRGFRAPLPITTASDVLHAAARAAVPCPAGLAVAANAVLDQPATTAVAIAPTVMKRAGMADTRALGEKKSVGMVDHPGGFVRIE